MTAMGNRFGIHGLEAASVHSERDVSDARISEVSRPTEDPVSVRELRSDFGSSCPDPEDKQPKFAARYTPIITYIVNLSLSCGNFHPTLKEYIDERMLSTLEPFTLSILTSLSTVNNISLIQSCPAVIVVKLYSDVNNVSSVIFLPA